MIVTKINGGLGNQMFQYAIAKAVAKKRNDKFKLDISIYPQQTLRQYELNYFNINENIATNEEIIKTAGNENTWFKIKRKLKLNPKRPQSYFREKEIAIFDNSVFNYEKDIYLDGYWQNEEYFKDIKVELLKDFTLKNDISQEAKKYLNDIKNTNAISLHIRRGDYIQNTHTSNIHGVCNLEYYKKAIDYIYKYIQNPTFYIFSDDIAWCKKNFNFLQNKVFVDNTKNAFDDLTLMINCNHNVIANSTFSWWGAWLNSKQDQIVVAPKLWWESIPEKNISLDKWIKI